MKAAVYNPAWDYAGGGEKVTAIIAERLAAAGWDVCLYGSPAPDIAKLQRVLNVDLSPCSIAEAVTDGGPLARLALRISPRASRVIQGRSGFGFARGSDLLVHITGEIPPICPARRGLLFVQFPYRAEESIQTDASGKLLRMADREKLRRIQSWSVALCPSRFVQSWTQRRWGVRPEVLYPPAEISECHPGEKQKTILTMGRFYCTGPTKKHAVMVQAFREMCDAGLDGWRLVVAGGTHPRSDHQQYVEDVRALAAGYPIDILTDLTFGQVLPLYAESSIYWHATGSGEDPETSPEMFEQFGMTIVEAMAAGAAPVVIAHGGPGEIVRDGTDGFVWRDPAELMRRTLELIDSPVKLAHFQHAAGRRAQEFSRAQFEKQADSIIAGI